MFIAEQMFSNVLCAAERWDRRKPAAEPQPKLAFMVSMVVLYSAAPVPPLFVSKPTRCAVMCWIINTFSLVLVHTLLTHRAECSSLFIQAEHVDVQACHLSLFVREVVILQKVNTRTKLDQVSFNTLWQKNKRFSCFELVVQILNSLAYCCAIRDMKPLSSCYTCSFVISIYLNLKMKISLKHFTQTGHVKDLNVFCRNNPKSTTNLLDIDIGLSTFYFL